MSVFGNTDFGKQSKSPSPAQTVDIPVEGAPEKKGAKKSPDVPVEVKAPKTMAEKMKAIVELGKAMDAEFKTTGTLLRLADQAGIPVPNIPTGLPSLDNYVLGCGGVPKGRIIEVYGPESAGKTTITLDIIATAQRAGGLAGFVDAEHALDPQYAALLGVDMEKLFVSQPDCGEQALQIVERLVDSRAIDIIVVDSVTALVPRAELAGEIGDANIGLQARMMSQALRMLVGKVAKSGVILIFINQVRDKIGVMFGNPETTTGGKALKFFSSVRLDVRKTKYIGEGGKVKEFQDGDKSDPIGNVIKVKSVKNKVAPPFRVTELYHLYDSGLDRVRDTLTFGDNAGVFTKRGSWFDLDLGNEIVTLGNGAAAATEFLKANPKFLPVINAMIWDKLNPVEESK